jgi:hypothetical protein
MSFPRLGLAMADRRFSRLVAFRGTAAPHPSRRTGIGKGFPKKYFRPNPFPRPDRLQRASGRQRVHHDWAAEIGSTKMKRTLIRYRTKPEATQPNERLIENVFQELQAKSPEGVRYMALKLADGTFLHFVETDDGSSPLTELDAFRSFQAGVRDRCAELPQADEATIVGNYRMLGER